MQSRIHKSLHRRSSWFPMLCWLVVVCLSMGSCSSNSSNGEPQEQAEPETTAAEDPDTEHAASDTEQDALHKENPVGSYGAGIVLEKGTALDDILANPESFEGKIVQVSGEVAEVCPRRGCWIDLASAESKDIMRVKVQDGVIVFPLSAKGKTAVVEGIVEKIELNEEQHRAWKQHEAEEKGETFDPDSVSGPAEIWRIQGLGAKIKS